MLNVSSNTLRVFLLLVLIFATAPFQIAAAGNITVNTADDELNIDGDCALREAIEAANTDAAVDACSAGASADHITFSGNFTITLTSTLPDIVTEMTITGNDAANTVIQADANTATVNYRIIQVTTGNLTLENLKLQNGSCKGGCAIWPGYGGAVYNAGSLAIFNSVLANNHADSGGGGIYHVSGTTTIGGTLFDSNNSGWGGGGIYFRDLGNITVFNCTFTNNTGLAYGGGIYSNYGSTKVLTVINSTFSGNTASNFLVRTPATVI